MQMARCLYLKRDWREDEKRMRRAVRHLSSVYGASCSSSSSSSSSSSPPSLSSFQLLLFPEGTDLTPETTAKSDAFADKNNRQRFK